MESHEGTAFPVATANPDKSFAAASRYVSMRPTMLREALEHKEAPRLLQRRRGSQGRPLPDSHRAKEWRNHSGLAVQVQVLSLVGSILKIHSPIVQDYSVPLSLLRKIRIHSHI